MVSKAVMDIPYQEDFQTVSARSQTECILKCNRKNKESFYTNEKACICASGILDSRIIPSISSKVSSGRLYLEVHLMFLYVYNKRT